MAAAVEVAVKEAMLGRFKGCLLGALVGDCLGKPFEMDPRPGFTLLNNYIARMEDPTAKLPFKGYTDDTAMTRGVAQSLLDHRGFYATDMSKKFVREFYAAPGRGYGENIVDVFVALKATAFKDVHAPAALQFRGTGSYGNGGAMRVSPVALMTQRKKTQVAADMARETALLTHAHPLGYNGAILQCLAVHGALNTSHGALNPNTFVEALVTALTALHNPNEDDIDIFKEHEGKGGFVDKLRLVQELLGKADDVTRDDVEKRLGTDVTALYSVPTAIYVFLRALQPIPGIESDSELLRAVVYGISLGGDTDTIASMAGAIAGAYHGVASMPAWLGRHCEGWDHALLQAQQLHALVYTTEP